MIEITKEQKQQIDRHVLDQYPKEACGILTEDSYIPCENVHEEPEKHFRFSKLELAIHFRSAIAIVHSHCRNPRKPCYFDPRTPSYSDFKHQKLTNKPWFIVDCEGYTVSAALQFPRTPNQEYVGRPFIWFINDCYTLVQDWYKFELGIELKEYQLERDYQEIKNMNCIFTEHIEDYGFVEVPLAKITKGDLLLLDNAGFRENHLGIYTKGQVLHQDMRSVSVPFQNFLGRINKVLHYVG